MRPFVYERDTTQWGFWYRNQANNPNAKGKYGSNGVSLDKLYDLLHKKPNYFHAKIVQAEDKGSLLTLLRRSLFYAKIVQAEDKGSLLTLLRRSLSYAKINIIAQITPSNVYAISIQAIIFLIGH